MPWVKIRSDFHTNPKVAKLAEELVWTPYHTRGFLLHFWDWVLIFNDSGDLSSVTPSMFKKCFDFNEEGAKLVWDALKKTRFVDEVPYVRVHDWWDHQKEYLKQKYYVNQLWKQIEIAYHADIKPRDAVVFEGKRINEDALRLAKTLFFWVKKNNPNSIARENHIYAWADSIRMLHDIDQQEYPLIEDIIVKSQKDEFWRSNILSGGKLRHQWNQLTAKFAAGGTRGTKPAPKPDKYAGTPTGKDNKSQKGVPDKD